MYIKGHFLYNEQNLQIIYGDYNLFDGLFGNVRITGVGDIRRCGNIFI